MATALLLLGDSKRCVNIMWYVSWTWGNRHFYDYQPFGYTFLETNFSTMYTLQIKEIKELRLSDKY